MSATITKFMAVADETEQTELKLAHNGHVQAMAAYQAKSGKTTKEDLDAARAYFDETVERLTVKYFSEDAKIPVGERFKGRKQALNWLNANGYKVSRGKFYADCANGYPAVHKDKTVSRYQIMEYAHQLDATRTNTPDADYDNELRELKLRKERAEVEIAERKNRKEDARWMEKVEHETQMAAFAGLFEDTLQQHITIKLSELVYLAGGNISQASEFAHGLDGVITTAMTESVRETTRPVAFDAEEEEETEALAEQIITVEIASPELVDNTKNEETENAG